MAAEHLTDLLAHLGLADCGPSWGPSPAAVASWCDDAMFALLFDLAALSWDQLEATASALRRDGAITFELDDLVLAADLARTTP